MLQIHLRLPIDLILTVRTRVSNGLVSSRGTDLSELISKTLNSCNVVLRYPGDKHGSQFENLESFEIIQENQNMNTIQKLGEYRATQFCNCR